MRVLRGARCGNSARRDLRGGHRVIGVPTSIVKKLMQRNHYHLAIVTSVIVLLSIASLVVFSPGYLEYQQIRWRAKISPKQIETGMTGMLAALWGDRERCS